MFQGRADEALEAADGALARNPEDDEARFARASVLRVMTRYAEAEAEFTRLIDRQPDMVGALSGRSMVRSALGDAGARADLEALAAAPDPKPAIQEAVALYAAYRYADAAAVIATALERPDLARAERTLLRGLGSVVNEALGRPDEALTVVDAELADHPDDLVLHEARALALIGLGRPDAAVISARRALAGAPRNPELLETTGIAERLAGRADVALPRLLAAAAARPDSCRAGAPSCPPVSPNSAASTRRAMPWQRSRRRDGGTRTSSTPKRVFWPPRVTETGRGRHSPKRSRPGPGSGAGRRPIHCCRRSRAARTGLPRDVPPPGQRVTFTLTSMLA